MYIIIINPTAGQGRAKRIHSRLRKLEKYQRMNPVCYYTKYQGHAELIASKIKHKTEDVKALIVIGGDGTMHEVMNGLRNKQIPLFFIPGGSGNDFARGINAHQNPKKAFKSILENKRAKSYWLGNYKEENKTKRHFINCVGVGFDAVVAKSANRSKLKKIFNPLRLGTLVYTLTIIRELWLYKPINLVVETEKERINFPRCFLLTVNNHAYFGGGMKINPVATNQCDFLSMLVVDSISKWKVLALFITVFFGKHLYFKEVKVIQANKIKLSANCPMPYQVDGEYGRTVACTINKDPIPVKVNGC